MDNQGAKIAALEATITAIQEDIREIKTEFTRLSSHGDLEKRVDRAEQFSKSIQVGVWLAIVGLAIQLFLAGIKMAGK